MTPLIAAVQHMNLDVVRRLVQAGADPTVPDSLGFTALDYARDFRAQEFIDILMARVG